VRNGPNRDSMIEVKKLIEIASAPTTILAQLLPLPFIVRRILLPVSSRICACPGG
jgi:hypothetical protein